MVRTKVKCFGSSDPGRVRRNNEDAFYIDADRGIFLVVDGIGGQAAGEKAAEIAVSSLRERLGRQIGSAEERIREAIAIANKEILLQARGNPEWRGMACVLTVAVLENGEAVVGHVGDSRLYKIRQGKIRKVTHDHSPVGEREESGELSEAEAMRHPRRNEVFRDVGSEEHTPDDDEFIEVQRISFDPDSALLLCSDGLSDQVGSEEIRTTVERYAGEPSHAVRDLIDAANRAGGKDNVTVLIVEGDQFRGAPPPAAITVAPLLEPVSRGSQALPRAAWFLCGLLLAAAAAWLTRSQWVPPPVVIKPRILTVGPGAAYTTIAAAITEARPGDTVDVQVGDYPEQVRLKTGVTVLSHVPREAVLRGVPASTGPAIVAASAKDARIAGFQIVADPHAPLSPAVLLENSAVEVEDLDIGGAAVGIEIRGGAPRVVGNSVHDCSAEGILIGAGSTPWISHNALQRNKTAGLAALAGAKPILAENVFEKNILVLPADVSSKRDFLIDIPKPRPSGAAPTRPHDETPRLTTPQVKKQ
jgi:serine/threonine protein phosphatase PrpC